LLSDVFKKSLGTSLKKRERKRTTADMHCFRFRAHAGLHVQIRSDVLHTTDYYLFDRTLFLSYSEQILVSLDLLPSFFGPCLLVTRRKESTGITVDPGGGVTRMEIYPNLQP
jgi:hypothetical protein